MDTKPKISWLKYGAIVAAILAVVFAVIAYNANVKNNELESNIVSLNGEIDKATADIAKLNGDISALTEVNAKIVAENAAAQEANANLIDTVNEIKALLDTKNAQIGDLEQKLEVAVGVPLEGYVIDEIALGASITDIVNHNDLSELKKGTISFNDDNYDFKQEIMFSPAVVLATNGFGYDEDFGSNAYLVLEDKGALTFRTTFTDEIDVTEISKDEPLTFDLAGESFSVVSMDDLTMEVRHGVKLNLIEGKPADVEGKTITLIDVSSNAALFDVDGEQAIVKEGSSETINGVEIYLNSVFESHSVDYTNDMAEIYAGSNVYETLDNGKNFQKDPDWYMYWQVVGDKLQFIEVMYNERAKLLKDDYQPLAAGDKIDFPYGIYSIVFDGLTEQDYASIDISLEEKGAEDDLIVDTNMVLLEASDKIFNVDGEEVDELYLSRTNAWPAVWNVYYTNDDNEFTLAGTSVVIKNGDYETPLVLQTTGDRNLVIGDVSIDVRPSDLKIGDAIEDAEAIDILVNGISFGLVDNDVLTTTGIKLIDVKNGLENDEVSLEVPSDVVEGTVRVVYNG